MALIRGGDSGIGRAVCYLFAQEGATVAFTYVKEQEDKDANDTIQMIKKVKTSDAKDPRPLQPIWVMMKTARRLLRRWQKPMAA